MVALDVFLSVILKERFPEGKIFYDTTYGHFIFQYNDNYYDWSGVCDIADRQLIEWDKFKEYDSLWEQRIIRDCIM